VLFSSPACGPERQPEEWLLKAWNGDVLVDVIFQTVEGEVGDKQIARGELLTVTSMAMNVLRLEDMFALRLQTLHEHHLDHAALLKMARALHEQVDRNALRARVDHTPDRRVVHALRARLLHDARGARRAEAPGGDERCGEILVRPAGRGPRSHVAFGPVGHAVALSMGRAR
jgi:hypothetical protein